MTAEAAELEDLKRRLTEAEDTLRAIRDGEVDALIVRGAKADEIFHLGGDESYRGFMEAMDMGAAALDEHNRLLYANAALTGLIGLAADELQRVGLIERLGAIGGAIDKLLQQSAHQRVSAQVVLNALDGKRQVVITAAPLPLGFSVGRALTFTDITDRMDAAAADESQRVGRAVMASAIDAVVVCDRSGLIAQANPAAIALLGLTPVGRSFEDAFDLTFSAGGGVMAADDVVALTLSGGQVRGLEAALPSPKGARDVLIHAAPLRYAGGIIGGCVVTLADVTERNALQKRQSLLMRELDHRMKNMLTLVASINTRTLATSPNLADFRERFNQRLSALAATQTLLAERAWENLSLTDHIQAELAPYVSTASSRVVLDDVDLQVSRDAAVALGLVFHELVTNAVKYGALSNEQGKVRVTVRRAEDGGFSIEWRELGGPPVSPPTRSGFGQTVIAKGLGHTAVEPTVLEFRPDGVVCRMSLSEEALAPLESE